MVPKYRRKLLPRLHCTTQHSNDLEIRVLVDFHFSFRSDFFCKWQPVLNLISWAVRYCISCQGPRTGSPLLVLFGSQYEKRVFSRILEADYVKDKKQPTIQTSRKENINLCPMYPNLYSMEDINDVSNTNVIGYAPNWLIFRCAQINV